MQRNVTCPSCHRGLFAGDAFCSWCGTPLGDRTEISGAARRSHATETIAPVDRKSCTSCNSPILPGDTFCATCGARYGEVEPPAPSGYDSRIPSQLVEANRGKYEILRELGRGGMGYVYLARDLELNRLDAIKVLKPSMLSEESMVERFRLEARTIANLRHQSIVTVYGVGNAEHLYYFVMDYIDGTSLSRILKHVGRLSVPVVEAILYQVGSALSYAHKSVVHRDVKPANIMLNREGRAIVTDFGIAKVTEVQGGLTRTGVLMGTPEYMSPEQCRESSVTHHTDQYALGAVAFAMLTGAPPYTGQWMQVAAAHQNNPVPQVQDARPDCPDELAQTVERMLAKYPKERWPDINDALRHLNLRPLAHDDPARLEIAELVAETMDVDAAHRVGEVRPASRTPTDLRIVAPPDEVELGDVVALHASMVFSDGIELHGEGLSWESTDPSIARVSNTGELEAVGVGSVQITARHGEVSGTLAVGVVPPRVVELSIHPRSVQLEGGETVQMRAEARNKHGHTVDRRVTWSSSDPRLVRVSDDGLVTARSMGTTSVLATCDGAGSSADVVVLSSADTVPPHGSTPPSGQRASATLQEVPATPAGGSGGADSGGWQPDSSDGGAARGTSGATDAGRTPRPEPTSSWRRKVLIGFVVLAAAAAGSAPFLIPSSEPEVVDLRVTNAATGESVNQDLELSYGASLRLVATAADEEGNPLERTVTWRSEDPAVAAIDAGGLLSAVGSGVTRIIASVDSLSRTIPLTVTVDVDRIEIVDATGARVTRLTLDEGETMTAGVRVLGEDDSELDGRPVVWETDDDSVVSVDASGVLTASAAGIAVIGARTDGVSSEVIVTVVGEEAPPPPANPVVVEINVGPTFANLFVDGAPAGQESRSYSVPLMPGPHIIRLEHPAFQTYTDTIDVQPGQPPLDITMIRR